MDRRAGLGRPVVMLVTDRRRLAERAGLAATDPVALDALVALAGEAARAGVDVIQLREADLDGRTLAALVRRVLSAAAGTHTGVVVNERIDVALACGAAGVHLPERAIPPDRARTMVPPGFLIGRSVHGPQRAGQSGGVDYLVFGSVFETRSKPAGHRVQGLGGLEAAVAAASGTPVIAIGGVGLAQLSDVARAGAAGVAAVDLFLPAEDRPPLLEIVKLVHEAFDTPQLVS